MQTLRSGLYAILDTDRLGWHEAVLLEQSLGILADYARAAVAGGAIALQLRAKGVPLGHPVRRQAVAALREVCADLPIVVNDDALAVLPGVGMHLGQDDGDLAAARRQVGTQGILGLSTHTLAQVRAAAALDVDYLGFGPIRATTGKLDADATTGLAGLRAAVEVAVLPVVAIGGLELADLAAIHGTGARAAAVIGAWLGPIGWPHRPDQAERALAGLVAEWQRLTSGALR